MGDRWKQAWERWTALFEMSGGGRIAPMEGLRGIAILMVLLVHHGQRFRGWTAPGGWSAAYAAFAHAAGQAGVDLFFALSGYLVYSLALQRKTTLAGFIGRRLRRIYPPFLAMMAVYVGIFLLAPGVAKWPAGGEIGFVVQSLLLLPGVFEMEPVMTVAWSLSYELAFYLTMPAAVVILGMERWSRARRVGLIAGLAAGYVAGMWMWFPGQLEWVPLAVWNRPRILLFAAGMLAWEHFDGLKDKRAPGWMQGAAAALMAAAVASCYPLADPAFQQPWPSVARTLGLGVGSYALMVAAFSGEGWLARVLSTAPLRRLGNCSYSFYLAHSLGVHAAGVAAERALPAAAWQETGFWLMLPVTLALASMATLPLYLLVERPFSLRKAAFRAGRSSAN